MFCSSSVSKHSRTVYTKSDISSLIFPRRVIPTLHLHFSASRYKLRDNVLNAGAYASWAHLCRKRERGVPHSMWHEYLVFASLIHHRAIKASLCSADWNYMQNYVYFVLQGAQICILVFFRKTEHATYSYISNFCKRASVSGIGRAGHGDVFILYLWYMGILVQGVNLGNRKGKKRQNLINLLHYECFSRLYKKKCHLIFIYIYNYIYKKAQKNQLRRNSTEYHVTFPYLHEATVMAAHCASRRFRILTHFTFPIILFFFLIFRMRIGNI